MRLPNSREESGTAAGLFDVFGVVVATAACSPAVDAEKLFRPITRESFFATAGGKRIVKAITFTCDIFGQLLASDASGTTNHGGARAMRSVSHRR